MIRTEHSGVSYRQSEAQARHMMFSFQYKARIMTNNGIETAQNWKNYLKRFLAFYSTRRGSQKADPWGKYRLPKSMWDGSMHEKSKRRSHFQNSVSE